ncbi:MAG TPA: cobalamin-binding protein [Thermoplasmata archaeon]|nr:cobalamin-binding protein [Thermoplasmata archaeon]
MRIVSLLPSSTEIVCALGAERLLVGRSSECDFPPSVRALPAVMRPKLEDFFRPSSEIDARVRRVRANGESLYALDLGLLRSLRPDLLITQDLCSVCSVTEAEAAAACASAGISPRVVSLSPRTLAEVWASIGLIGASIGHVEEAKALVRSLPGGSPHLRDGGTPPRVAVVEWVDPPILAGLWANEMIESAGGRSIGPGVGEVGERTSWKEIDLRAPDLVVISPCSFGIERTRRELRKVRLPEAWKGRYPRLGCWLADEAFFSRPGPRLAEGVALIRALAAGSTPSVTLPFERWGARGTAT